MSGSTLDHARITANVGIEIGVLLKNERTDCEIFSSDARVYIEEAQSFVYPDVMVSCGPTEISAHDKNSLTNPVLVVEVLLPSTELYDRVEKFLKYAAIPSLKEYVLIDQNRVFVEIRYRNEAGKSWEVTYNMGLSAEINLRSIGAKLILKDIYRSVKDLDLNYFSHPEPDSSANE